MRARQHIAIVGNSLAVMKRTPGIVRI